MDFGENNGLYWLIWSRSLQWYQPHLNWIVRFFFNGQLKKKIVLFFSASHSTPRYYTFFLISAKNPKSEEKNGTCFLVIHWINNEPKKNNKCWNLQTKYSLIKNYNFCIFDKSGITSVNIYPLTAWYISIKRVYRTFFFFKKVNFFMRCFS